MILLFFALIVFNYVDLFSSFNNSYIFDLQDKIEELAKTQQECTLFVEEKEFKRLEFKNDIYPANQVPLESLDNLDKAKVFLKSYSLFSQVLFLALSDKNRILSTANKELKLDLKKIATYKTSKNNNWFSIYRFNTEQNIPHKAYQKENNLIVNGDCEKLLNQTQKKNKLKNWIDQGAAFYLQESVDLPESSIIVPTVSPYLEKSFPEVYAEKDNPINGNYSLHIKLKPHNTLPIYLFNHLPVKEGVFSFSARSLSKNKIFRISINSYGNPSEGAVRPKYSTFYFLLQKDRTYNIELKIDKEMLYGNKIIFLLQAEEIELILDDVSFIPNEAS